jgi:hypothetical protein
MMKRIYSWLTKANQVLLFFVLLGGIVLICYGLYVQSGRYDPPHVTVAQTPQEAEKSIVEDIHFLGRSSTGIYVLGLVKHMVKPEREPWGRSVAYLGSPEQGQIVNVVFSKGDRRIRTLLPRDGLVLRNNAGDEKDRDTIKMLTFDCVTEDTDGNHRLDDNDRHDLYLVAEGLERSDMVVAAVVDYRPVAPGRLIVKTKEGEVIRFWDIDTSTQAKAEIVWN